MTTQAKITLGLVSAAAAGVAAGMLFAPKKGKKLRAQIRQTTGDITSDLVDSVQKSRQQLLKAVEVIENKAQGFKSMVFNDKTKETEALLEEEINKKEMAAA